MVYLIHEDCRDEVEDINTKVRGNVLLSFLSQILILLLIWLAISLILVLLDKLCGIYTTPENL